MLQPLLFTGWEGKLPIYGFQEALLFIGEQIDIDNFLLSAVCIPCLPYQFLCFLAS